MNKINFDQITIDTILEKLGEDYIFYQKDIGFVLMWEDLKDYCNSLVEQDYAQGRGVGVKEDEQDEMGDCPFCFQPFVKPKTDEEISLRVYEEYESTLVESESYINQLSFPDWLKEQTK